MQGAGCAGSLGNRIGQLAPCASRLSKQPGAVQGCRNGGELASEFLARGTGSTRRPIASRRGPERRARPERRYSREPPLGP